MKCCQTHWDALRAAIDARGLSHLIAPDGETAAAQVASELTDGPMPTNYDPLMAAHWAVLGNATRVLSEAGSSPLYLMQGDDVPEDPVEGHEGRTWPRCPLCYLNLAHELSCKDARCTLDQERGYDWMIDRAADDQAARARELRPEP